MKKSKPVDENLSHKLPIIAGCVKAVKMEIFAGETEYFNIKEESTEMHEEDHLKAWKKEWQSLMKRPEE